MKALAIALALILLASVAGTASTVVIYSAIWQEPTDLDLKIAGVLAGHFVFCALNVSLGETIIEDAVKSFIIAILGTLFIFSRWPLGGLTLISIGLFTFTANQVYCWMALGSDEPWPR